MHVAELLNRGILGSNAGTFKERTFNPVPMDNITSPEYSPRFFETFPTMWATAYAFEKSLRKRDNAAVREWASLLMLQYFRYADFVWIDGDDLALRAGPNLSAALSGSFPPKGFERLGVLRMNDGTVVGAYYPTVVFFPSRGRAGWRKSALLEPFLTSSNALDWERCKAQFLTDAVARNAFNAHLKAVASAVGGSLGDVLDDFRVAAFATAPAGGVRELDPGTPEAWLPNPPKPRVLLDSYPLRRFDPATRRTRYYLVGGLPTPAGWMSTQIMAGMPTPSQYVRAEGSEHAIYVRFGGDWIRCPLEEGDEVIALEDLLLQDAPYFCAVNGRSHPSKIKPLHRVGNRDTGGIFSDFAPEEVGVLLAPLRTAFLEHFPEVMRDAGKRVVPSIDRAGESVTWTVTVLDREIRITTNPIRSLRLPDMKLALWPPKVCDLWRLYVARGTGVEKAKCGRLALVDETGRMGDVVELEEDVYISVLQDASRPNRPRGLVLLDPSDEERGVFFLSDLPEQSVDLGTHVGLAVDFGTSNTCLARQLQGRKPESLAFDLSPEMLWGERPALETPGFVPFDWAGGKGFFPTILLSRKSVKDEFERLKVTQIRPDHLFKVDLVGLHLGVDKGLVHGEFDALWNVHANMKWRLDDPHPWRSVFLATALLYAHAQVCFGDGAMVHDYVFTFPLAFSAGERKTFHADAKVTVSRIREFCYGSGYPLPETNYNAGIDESTAIAASAMAVSVGSIVEVFVDVGGGTTDLAIRHDNKFLVLDSVRVAGNAFFQFAAANFDSSVDPHGCEDFKSHLARLLLRDGASEFPEGVLKKSKLDLATFYSLAINSLDDREFHEKEAAILERGMGRPSYQLYRSVLFFRHLLAYALLQSCAAVVGHRLKPANGFSLILGGNGWGLLLFGELERSKDELLREARTMLGRLKHLLADSLTEEERPFLEDLTVSDVTLLNEHDLSQSKTAVAKGALLCHKRNGASARNGSTQPYAGITIDQLRINAFDPVRVRWCERWGFNELSAKVGGSFDQMSAFGLEVSRDLSRPLDPVLSLFTRLANSENKAEDPLPQEDWVRLNGLLSRGDDYLDEKRKPRYSPVNYFLSRLLYPSDQDPYFLDKIAQLTGTFRRR
jgi:hypothetical protein